MKVSIIQPHYSMVFEDADKCFDEILRLLDSCDDSMDLIVLPEYCDVPTDVPDGEAFNAAVRKYNAIIAKKASQTAKRCHAIIFANYASSVSGQTYRNTTHAFDREGHEVGIYFKAHPAPSEVKTISEGGNGMDCSYSYEYAPQYVLEIDGLRFGFMTCYDFYMYEGFSALARMNVDMIIGCSHQRTDTHDTLEIIGRFLSYNTNAYLIRSAVSLGKDSQVCGCSMVVSPKGEMLLNMKNETGIASIDIDPAEKYYKPAGFKGKLRSHHEYIDEGRRPWLYRPAGSMMIADDEHLYYPRICAHRGFSTIAPENSLPAFGAAVALGAEEIEFDLWTTKDGKLVSIHDSSLDRVSNGKGSVWNYTLEELKKFDFGNRVNEHFKGLEIITFEDILKKLACTSIMNIHVKIWDRDDMDHHYKDIADLIRQYGCEKHCYMMSSTDKSLQEFHDIAPDISLCIGWNNEKDDMLAMVNRAITINAQKVQLYKPYFDQSSVDYAHANGIICNIFYADDPVEAARYIDMGMDCILTNDYLNISNAVRDHLSKTVAERSFIYTKHQAVI
ncbi:MAG: glycerophosphodiester phosphodiesterase family protein [Clostridia bacterium]